jgi:shikimate kinase
MTIALVGPMGSGKSHIARDLARISGLPFVDLDAEIERRAENKISAIFRTQGEEVFRQLETKALRDALERGGILATGGGVVTRPENCDLLREANVVYLRATPETLATRIRQQPGTRPLIDGDGALDFDRTRARIEEILSVRAPLYQSVAQLVLDTDVRPPRELAQEIWTTFRNR